MLDDPIHDEGVKVNYERINRLYLYSFKIVEFLIDLKLAQGSYEGAIQAVYLRAYYCLSSLAKLDRPGDFQAVRATARILFELYLDLVFLKDNFDSYKKYHSYNKLGHMKSALELAKFIEDHPSDIHEIRYFDDIDIATDPSKLAECKMLLMKLYNRTEESLAKNLAGFIPGNWTGIKGTFERIKDLDLVFLEYYMTEVCQSNWYVHGGAVGVGGRTPEMFASIWSRGHDLSFRLLCKMTCIAFEELELLDSVPDLNATLRSFA